MRRADALARPLLLLLLAGLGGCGLFRKAPVAEDPTIASLAGRKIDVEADSGPKVTERQAIEAYRRFLDIAPKAPQRAQAMRRLGDLEMDSADRDLVEGSADKPDYKAAIERYQDYLKNYPNDPGNDKVLYQLARAHEGGGELEPALKVLNRLVAEHPGTAYAAEAQFRRGELLFSTRDYAGAEGAYATVLAGGERTPFHERALYMQGWSRFKQGRLDDALKPLFGVLDAKLGREGAELSRADRELVEDTFRVTSIALSNLQGAASVPPYIDSPARRRYEPQVYEQLGDLYLKQERVKDAADSFGAFARARPLHAQAPVLLSRVVDTYEKNGFGSLALDAKKDYVSRFGVDSEFRRANPKGWDEAQPLVKTHLAELARHHHALAQQSKAAADVTEAVRWYRLWLASFPQAVETPGYHFLMAELLSDDKRLPEAAAEFEKVAYGYPKHDKSAEAGYGALLAYAAQKDAATEARRAVVASSLRFADAFPDDRRTASVLTNAADQLYALQDGAQAATVAKRALATAGATPAERRTAWIVVAHTAFEAKAWSDAELAYGEAVALSAEGSAGRNELVERLAASVYQQGDAARTAGNARDAVAAFERVATLAPNSAVRATAQFDAAAALIGLSDWDGATRLLEDFRRRFPTHTLQGEVDQKLAAAYLAQGRWAAAAGELERVAAKAEPEVARAALWQAVELYDKAGDTGTAKAYERYLARYPQPLDNAVQARWRLAQLNRGPASTRWMQEVVRADATGGSARTDRTRALAAQAQLVLTEPQFEAYRKIALVEPLARQLKAKKAKMEEVLKAYAAVSDYGVAEATTAATFYTAALYQDFGKAMIGSQRPKKLSKAELEQYNVMLEEQAFPFEEKAIELHEANARRSTLGLYDDWVKKSFDALARLKPVRWGKTERSDPALALNQKGVEARRAGRFADAKAAYEEAIAADANAAAPILNLAILNDLYLGDGAKALELYERYLTLVTPADPTVTKWAAELKNRKPAPAAASVASKKDTP
jgi:cellulose synthase operon protein C